MFCVSYKQFCMVEVYMPIKITIQVRKMDQSNHSIGVEYFSIFLPLLLGMLDGCVTMNSRCSNCSGTDIAETRITKKGFTAIQVCF